MLKRTLAVLLLTVGCDAPNAQAQQPEPPAELNVRLELVTDAVTQPTSVTHAGDGSGRLFVTEKTGRVRLYQDGGLVSEPFLDLSSRVSGGGEQGLLGLAFHPAYTDNGRFFVNYTDLQGATVVAEYTVSDAPERADPDSERVILEVAQPYSNHNGGHLAFGPDGYLYIGTGDGGAGGDPEGNGQDLAALLGKMLRLDVDAGEPYAVPDDNPFVGDASAAPEVWAYGLRNPWKYTFDRETGDLWIADVGQNALEEVNVQPASSEGGENYGWNVMEASACYEASACDTEGLTLPVLEYPHSEGNSVTGGYVYRGEAIPALQGRYLFADFGSGTVWHAVREGEGYARDVLLETSFNVSTFGEDEAGEVYLADLGGALYRLVNAPE